MSKGCPVYYEGTIDGMHGPDDCPVCEVLERIEQNLGTIYVPEQMDGKRGSYSLAELPGDKAIAHAFRLLRMGTVVVVKDPEEPKTAWTQADAPRIPPHQSEETPHTKARVVNNLDVKAEVGHGLMPTFDGQDCVVVGFPAEGRNIKVTLEYLDDEPAHTGAAPSPTVFEVKPSKEDPGWYYWNKDFTAYYGPYHDEATARKFAETEHKQ